MVQNLSNESAAREPKRRGRPRAYDPDAALLLAMEAFWKSGYAATTLDDLSAATAMNRPSLYAAFGDKRDIYEKAYRQYRAKVRDEFRPILEAKGPVRLVLRKIFEASVKMYLSGPEGPRGCLTVVTAASDAIADPEIGKLVVEAIEALDKAFAALFSGAIARGELPALADAAALGRAATATIHTLAIRARARCPKTELRRIADDAIDLICGPERDGRATR
jgi:AcrR family transcriptional regulator